MNETWDWQKLPEVFTKILNSLPESVLVLDESLNILYANKVAHSLANRNILYEPFVSLLGEKEYFVSIIRELKKNATATWEGNIKFGLENTVSTFISIENIQQGNRDFFIVYVKSHVNKELNSKNEEIELANHKLLVSELKYKNIVENATDVIFSCDYKGYFSYTNMTACKMAGYTEIEFRQKHFTELIHPHYKQQAAQFYKTQFTNKTQATYYEFPILNKANQMIWLGQSVQMDIENNRITGLHAVARDITDRKLAELEREQILDELSERESRFTTIIENSTNNIWAIDMNGCFTAFNKEFKIRWDKYIKINLELGFNWLAYLKTRNEEIAEFQIWLNYLTRALNGEKFTFENHIPHGGKMIYHEVQVNPIINDKNKVTGTMFMSHDITDRKLEEQELIKAKVSAEDLLSAKEQFLSVMSHEIRTPLNGILGMTHLLAQEELTANQLEFIKSIRFSADNLLVIINDILDLSKIQAGKMEFEDLPFNLGEIVKNNVLTFEFAAKEKLNFLEYTIDPFIPATLIGDPTRLNQILTNLIGNAVKFTDNGSVKIIIKLLNQQNNINTIRFDIIDSGIGIKSTKINTIFDSFTQADTATTRQFGGTGLGLTITKRLVEMQQGQIFVKSQLNEGSTFSFIIDFKTGKPNSIMGQNPNETTLSRFDNLQVLIAEDNKMNQLVVSKLMSKWGVQIDIAEDGQEAIERTINKAYDIILMDLQMPNIDGYDATAAIRSDKQNPCNNTPIIALTASVTGDVKEKCLSIGMNDYVSKPIEPILLNQKISYFYPSRIINENQQSSNKTYVNLKYLLENADGDMGFVTQMINIFTKQVPESLKDLYREESNKDLVSLKAVSHKMRPSFSAFGIDEGKNILEEIESICAKNEKVETLVLLIKKLENICDIAAAELKKKLTEIENL